VHHFMNHWQHFLLGAKFEVVSDHQPVLWMFGQAEPPRGKMARWVLNCLSSFWFLGAAQLATCSTQEGLEQHHHWIQCDQGTQVEP